MVLCAANVGVEPLFDNKKSSSPREEEGDGALWSDSLRYKMEIPGVKVDSLIIKQIPDINWIPVFSGME